MVLAARSHMDKFLDEFYRGHEVLWKNSGNTGFPRTDIYSNDDTLTFDFALAGFTKEQIAIDMNPETNILTVKSINSFPSKNEDTVHWHQRQLAQRDFTVRYMIPTGYNLESCQASMKNGVLSISLSRNPETKPRQIKIE